MNLTQSAVILNALQLNHVGHCLTWKMHLLMIFSQTSELCLLSSYMFTKSHAHWPRRLGILTRSYQQQYFSLTLNQHQPPVSQQYFSFTANQHQPPVIVSRTEQPPPHDHHHLSLFLACIVCHDIGQTYIVHSLETQARHCRATRVGKPRITYPVNTSFCIMALSANNS